MTADRALVRLKRRIYAFAFLDEFGPLYGLYALLFSAHGLTAAQTSVVFGVWAAVPLVLEVPSGALADRYDRRRVIAAALALRAAGIALWLVWPTYAGMLAGAVLWAVHSALASGAEEALYYDELDAHGGADGYAQLMGRAAQASSTGTLLGTLGATGLLAGGANLDQLGWMTVAAHGFSIPLILSLPRAARAQADEDDDEAPDSWWQTLREGLSVARGTGPVGRLLLLGGVFEGLYVLDEYLPLLGEVRGAPAETIPLLVLTIWIGVVAGGELAARVGQVSRGAVAGLLVLASASMFVGLGLGHWAWLGAIGVGYAWLQVAWVTVDARLQEHLHRGTRATVTSVRAWGSGLTSVMAFAGVGALARGDDPTPGGLAVAGVYLGLALMAAAFVPPSPTTTAG